MKVPNLIVAIVAVVLATITIPASSAFWHGIAVTFPSGALRSQASLERLDFTTEFTLLNSAKTMSSWTFSSPSTAVMPDQLDATGIPKAATVALNSGVVSGLNLPSQTERPGHYVITWTGQGNVALFLNGSGGLSSFVSCTGGANSSASFIISCNNTACSTFTGSIAGTTLTVTAAPTGTGCGLGAGVPITGSGVTLSTFGTPTIITSAGSACGGNTCYTVNISQTVASTTMQAGTRLEVGTATPQKTIGQDLYRVTITAAGATSYAQNLAIIFNGTGGAGAGDETLYWNSAAPCPGTSSLACITSPIFQTRIKQANFGILRDLDMTQSNLTNCSTWATRKPINYFSYGAREYRDASSGPGQYVNAAGTGASGGTISYSGVSVAISSGSYNSSTGIVTLTTASSVSFGTGTQMSIASLTGTGTKLSSLDGSFSAASASGTTVTYQAATGLGSITITGGALVTSDIYNITLGSGNWQDKQTIEWNPPSTGTPTSSVSLNGNTAIPVETEYGTTGGFTPTAGTAVTSMFDAQLGLLSGTASGAGAGLNCPTPPEVFLEINAEVGTAPWHVLPFYALDAMTDWVVQHATYLKTNYPQMLTAAIKPTYEVMNEPNNTSIHNACYASNKAGAWAAIDTAWQGTQGIVCGTGSGISSEIGKMASTTGQDLTTTLGTGKFEMLVNMMPYLGTTTQDAQMMTSASYVAQTLIPVQSGYTQTAAYQYVTHITSNNYWNVGLAGVGDVKSGPIVRGLEVPYAYCYYNYTISTPCQGLFASQTALMTQYFASATTSSPVTGNVTGTIAQLQTFTTAAANCFTGGSRPGNCVLDSVNPMVMYEGGYSPNPVPLNKSLQTNASGDIIQPIGLSSTGPITAGSYSVTAYTSTTCTINSYGNPVITVPNNGCVVGETLAVSGTINSATTTASANWSVGAGSFAVASCAGFSSSGWVSDATTGNFIGDVSSCSGTTLTLISNSSLINSNGAMAAGSNGDTLEFSTGQIVYTGSNTWITYLRTLSYTAPELDPNTITLFNGLAGIGAIRPSQYLVGAELSSPFANGAPWYVWADDFYGFYTVATCTSCTISGSTLTLGGTITGIFASGQTLLGGGAVSGPATGAPLTTITSCTPIGSNVCGTTAGDTLGLSQASTVSSGQKMSGTIAAPQNNAGNSTTSPVRAWGAICRFNGNGNQCNGWLLKRDLDPSSNDNDPVGLEKAA